MNYVIDEETQNIILKLIETAESINLGNLLFDDYVNRALFSLEELNEFWQLIVNCRDVIDVYEVKNGVIEYKYTERHDQ